jgi:hypothetical protein
LGVGLCTLGLEIGLRLVPVNDLTGTLPVNEANPILRYVPDGVVWSRGWNLSNVNRVREPT